MIKIILNLSFITMLLPVFWSQLSFSQKGKVEEKNLDIVANIDKVYKIDFDPHRALTVGNTSILDYQIVPEKREIVFKGLKAGTTSVIIRNTVGDIKERLNVRVTATSQSQTVAEIKEFLGDIEGLKIGVKAGKVYLGGYIIIPEDVGKIVTVMEKYRDVIQLYELSPHTQLVIADKMQDEIRSQGMKDVTVRVINKVFWIEGVVTSQGQKELAVRIAEGFIPDGLQSLYQQSTRVRSVGGRAVIQDFLSINPKKSKPSPPTKLVKVVAQFVELSKDYSKIFGFKWTPTLAAGSGTIQFGRTVSSGVTTNSDGTFSGTISNLFPKLASAKSAGYARVIQSGMLIVKADGKEYFVKKSSTTPFVLGTGEFQRPLSASTGFDLKIKTTILQKETIEMGVGLTVTMNQGSNGTASNSLKTSLIINSKESAVVGGIAINETQTQYDKDPPFGTDTVDPNTGAPLFSFLKSKSHSINKSQFVVFLTPEIVSSSSEATNKIKKKFRQRRR